MNLEIRFLVLRHDRTAKGAAGTHKATNGGYTKHRSVHNNSSLRAHSERPTPSQRSAEAQTARSVRRSPSSPWPPPATPQAACQQPLSTHGHSFRARLGDGGLQKAASGASEAAHVSGGTSSLPSKVLLLAAG